MRFITLVSVVGCFVPSTAHAYTIATVVSNGCHERVTTRALRAVRDDLGIEPDGGTTRDDRAFIDDLPFSVPRDLDDIAAASVLVGVREPDVKGHSPTDTTDIAAIHNNPGAQQEHCLREPDDDEPDGTSFAVERCRERIVELVAWGAQAGMDCDAKQPALDRRTFFDIKLSMAGKQRVALPIFHVYLGQALHTLQDSFSHAFRTPDQHSVTVALNWVDTITGLDESRDGPAHMGKMDACKDIDSFRTDRMAAAVEASEALMRVALDPELACGDIEGAVRGVLDVWLTAEPGCSFDNRWCDAPERDYVDPLGCGCEVLAGGEPAPGRRGAAALFGLLVVVGAVRRTRSRRP